MWMEGTHTRVHTASSRRTESAHFKYDVKRFVFVSNIPARAGGSPQACGNETFSKCRWKNTADLQKQSERRNSAGVFLAGKELQQ